MEEECHIWFTTSHQGTRTSSGHVFLPTPPVGAAVDALQLVIVTVLAATVKASDAVVSEPSGTMDIFHHRHHHQFMVGTNTEPRAAEHCGKVIMNIMSSVIVVVDVFVIWRRVHNLERVQGRTAM